MLNNKIITSESDLDNNIKLIEQAYIIRDKLNDPDHLEFKNHLHQVINFIINQLENGSLRVAIPIQHSNSKWQTNSWVKKAILLNFIIQPNKIVHGTFGNYFDKIPAKFHETHAEVFQLLATRIVPPAYIRAGVYLGKNTVIMPSFINIGAFIDDGTMIDSWATIGSCAQIGKNVHISAGVNIGGVLEPMQDDPTIIEDHCFIGANSAILEGMVVEKNAVIGAGVILSKSTKIYDRSKDLISYGRIPSGSVVVPGNLISEHHKYSLGCAIIVKTIDQKTLNKTEINQILRELN